MEKRRNFLYLRLSEEDLEVSGRLRDESNSIVNQRLLLKSYIRSHRGLGTPFEEIVDDGYSGTSFERPGMSRLLELVEQDQVQTIIVKDLSRFGRNYLDAGFYQEILFPRHGVRLIAVNDRYDSAQKETSENILEWRLKNLQNQFYSMDLSRKIRSSTEVIRRCGQHIGQVPFGYLRGARKNQIVVDEDAAKTVRRIFTLAAKGGMEINDIARTLNSEEIPTPSQQKRQRGMNCHVRSFWCNNTVYRILTNRTYTGYLDLYKSHPKEIGSKKFDMIPREEREIVRGQHTPLVTLEEYEQAQKVIHCKGEPSGKPYQPINRPLLHNYLVCGCCGNKMLPRKTFGDLYVCQYKSIHLDSDCEVIECDAQEVEEIVFRAIQSLLAVSEMEKVQQMWELDDVVERMKQHGRTLRTLEKRMSAFDDERVSLYELYIESKITKTEYIRRKNCLSTEEQGVSDAMDSLMAEIELLRKKAERHQADVSGAVAVDTDHLTAELLKTLVSKVIISAEGNVEIQFRFKDRFQ